MKIALVAYDIVEVKNEQDNLTSWQVQQQLFNHIKHINKDVDIDYIFINSVVSKEYVAKKIKELKNYDAVFIIDLGKYGGDGVQIYRSNKCSNILIDYLDGFGNGLNDIANYKPIPSIEYEKLGHYKNFQKALDNLFIIAFPTIEYTSYLLKVKYNYPDLAKLIVMKLRSIKEFIKYQEPKEG